ncbi:DMT family transporter [Sediminibacterium ginsengisoli]|uniref:Permease of the drug/metabolite transporter (DMT) superfamily n=1 Tax=Sediminibacterium ginsengisoli TaxID=413434 RepID=A0A1T4JTY3_9BACT|nr:EamA family transporter [Sediminibacterium ginsengisoli]SJZ33601.1 Permease of the drug/metabolite transporter (DMT) superfamily [Sediminibacterium ginsengisoli]
MSKQKAYGALAVTSIVWGTTWVTSKIGVKHVPGLEIAAIRQFIAGTFFLVFFLLKGYRVPDRKTFGWLVLMAFLMFVLANGFATLALKYVPSGMAALIAALYPLSVVLIDLLFFKNTRITLLTFLGIVLGIGGIGLVFYDHAFYNHPEGYMWGVLLSFIAMLSWSIGTVIIARNKLKLNPYYATGWEMLISSVILFVMAKLNGDFLPINRIPLESWAAISYLIVAGSVITFIAFIYSMKHLEPAIAALYAYINPIVAILIGSMLLDEHLTFKILAGSVITLAGVFMVNRSLRKQRAVIAAQQEN